MCAFDNNSLGSLFRGCRRGLSWYFTIWGQESFPTPAPRDSGSFCYNQSKAKWALLSLIPLVSVERFLWGSHCNLGSQRQSGSFTHLGMFPGETSASICVSKFKGGPRCPEKGLQKSVVQSEGLALTLRCLSKLVLVFHQVLPNMKSLWSCGWGTGLGWECGAALLFLSGTADRTHTALGGEGCLALPLSRDMTSKWLRHLSLSFLIWKQR